MSSICISSNVNSFVNVDAFVREEEHYPLSSRSAMNLPIGYRFLPTDDELIVHYLKRKVYNQPLPYNNIPTFNLYEFAPENLCGYVDLFLLILGIVGLLKKQTLFVGSPTDMLGGDDGEKEWYLFSPRKRISCGGTRADRTTPHGHWKATSGDKPIKYNGEVVGYRKTLVCRMRSCYAESTTTIKNIDETAMEQLDTQNHWNQSIPTVQEEDQQQQQQIFSSAPETSHCPLAQDDFDGIDEPLMDEDLEFLYDIMNM
ncbi:UNVERIFIED_CONTAM: NAC domain-containing protein 68 [Sesamum radiatum]|uniref:NAC domain-containing protein 68 n=1 Tax=Sesamum radiatum TaxID=300843 RepID=A0AAW2NQV0_SESRA